METIKKIISTNYGSLFCILNVEINGDSFEVIFKNRNGEIIELSGSNFNNYSFFIL